MRLYGLTTGALQLKTKKLTTDLLQPRLQPMLPGLRENLALVREVFENSSRL